MKRLLLLLTILCASRFARAQFECNQIVGVTAPLTVMATASDIIGVVHQTQCWDPLNQKTYFPFLPAVSSGAGLPNSSCQYNHLGALAGDSVCTLDGLGSMTLKQLTLLGPGNVTINTLLENTLQASSGDVTLANSFATMKVGSSNVTPENNFFIAYAQNLSVSTFLQFSLIPSNSTTDCLSFSFTGQVSIQKASGGCHDVFNINYSDRSLHTYGAWYFPNLAQSAASAGRYGDQPVSLGTGAPVSWSGDVGIPCYTSVSTSDFTTSSTTLVSVTGLGCVLPANIAAKYGFLCLLSYANTVAASTNFGVGLTVAPTRLDARVSAAVSPGSANQNTSAITNASGTSNGFTAFTPTSTNPAPVTISGTIVNPSQAASTFSIMTSIAANTQAIKVGSTCSVWVTQ